MMKPDQALHEIARSARKAQEFKAMAEAWRRVEDVLVDGQRLRPEDRTRLRLAFDLGWRAGTNYHTGEVL